MSVTETDRRQRPSSGVQSGRCRRGQRARACRAAARLEDGFTNRHIRITPHQGMTAAGAGPPLPRLPDGRRALSSWRRKGEDRQRRMLRAQVARPGRPDGPGVGECCSGAGRFPRRPSCRCLSGGNGSEHEKRDYQKLTGLEGPFATSKAGPGEVGVDRVLLGRQVGPIDRSWAVYSNAP